MIKFDIDAARKTLEINGASITVFHIYVENRCGKIILRDKDSQYRGENEVSIEEALKRLLYELQYYIDWCYDEEEVHTVEI